VVYAPAGRLLDAKGPLEEAFQHRLLVQRNINVGYWGYRNFKDAENADLEFLDDLREIRHDKSLGFLLRVEEPRVQIYAETEQQLQNLISTHFKPEHYKYVESFSGPADADAEELLNAGAIIRKKDVGYKYKVILRDGKYNHAIKSQLLQYLLNLGPEEIHLPKSAIDTLQSKNSFVWNLYFYCNDLSVNTFITLISPGIILNHHELIVHK
jgi:hypothetical protein